MLNRTQSLRRGLRAVSEEIIHAYLHMHVLSLVATESPSVTNYLHTVPLYAAAQSGIAATVPCALLFDRSLNVDL